MSDKPEIAYTPLHSTYYGKAFTVVVGSTPNGTPFVHSVDIEGLPTYRRPDIDVPDGATVDQALHLGARFACSQIDH